MRRPLGAIELWETLAREANFQPAAMASLCRISLRQLERIFDKQFQKTPGAWVRELQCREAQRLIASGYSTKAAAAELKFADQSHFCHEFRKVFGASPQTFAPSYIPTPNGRC